MQHAGTRSPPSPPKNAILDLCWAGCSPIFRSSKRLPSRGLAGLARAMAAVQGASRGWHVPTAAGCPRETRPWLWCPGTWSCGCCTAQNWQPSSSSLRATVHGLTPPQCRAAQHRSATERGWEAESGSPAPGRDAQEHQTGGSVSPPQCELAPGWGTLGTALPTDPQAGAEEGHRETLARHKAWGRTLAVGGKNGEKEPNVTSPGGDTALLLPQPLPRQTCTLAPLPRLRHRAQLSPHPPQNPKAGGQTLPHVPESDSPEQGGGGGQTGSSPLARARGARRGANFPGLMQDASGSAFAFCGFLGAGQKSHNPTSCTFGFN